MPGPGYRTKQVQLAVLAWQEFERWCNTSLEADCFSSGQLHGTASIQQHSSGQLHGAVSSDKQLAGTRTRRLDNRGEGDFTFHKIFSTPRSVGMDVVNYHIMRLQARAARPERNGMEIHRWCAGDRTANGRARVWFQWNRMERNCQCFMPPTVYIVVEVEV